MKIAIANDHAGVEYKNSIVKMLEENGHEVINFGTDSNVSCDYPDYAQKVARAVQQNTVERGILVCGTGIGMSICANKFKGVRAGLCTDEFSAEMTRLHNDSNVLCLGARVIDLQTALKVALKFISTNEPIEKKHQVRLDKIDEYSDF